MPRTGNRNERAGDDRPSTERPSTSARAKPAAREKINPAAMEKPAAVPRRVSGRFSLACWRSCPPDATTQPPPAQPCAAHSRFSGAASASCWLNAARRSRSGCTAARLGRALTLPPVLSHQAFFTRLSLLAGRFTYVGHDRQTRIVGFHPSCGHTPKRVTPRGSSPASHGKAKQRVL